MRPLARLVLGGLVLAGLYVPAWAQGRGIEEELTVESLLHSARNLYHDAEAPGRAGRLVAMVQYVQSLEPQSVSAQRFLADIYQSQDKLHAAEKAARAIYKANPANHTAAQRWLRFRLALLNRADERSSMLKTLIDTSGYSKPLRSEAAVELAKIYLAQGAQSHARAVLGQALELDPWNHSALLSRLDLTEDPTVNLRMETMISLLRGNPKAWWVVVDMADLFGQAGLHEAALELYRAAWRIRSGQEPIHKAPRDFAAEYLSAMLDADQARQAVALFEPALGNYRNAGEFQALMIEAYRSIGAEEKIAPIQRRLEDLYEAELAAEEASTLDNADPRHREQLERDIADRSVTLAWFYLLTQRRPLKAMQLVSKAQFLGAEGAAIELVTGSAQLASGQEEEGVKHLQPLVDRYPLAAAFLAEHYYNKGEDDKAREVLLKGLSQNRKDLAYRKLRDLAKKHEVSIPPHRHAEVLEGYRKTMDPRILRMGESPREFLSIGFEPLPEMLTPGQPLTVEVTLKNTSDISFCVGQWGLIQPVVGMVVQIDNRSELLFESLPVVSLPSPRNLQPGEQVTGQARLDVGPLGEYLTHHAMEELDLEVRAIISPKDVGRRIETDIPSIPPPVARLKRAGLLGPRISMAAETFNNAYRSIESALEGESLPMKLLAVRRVGILLSWLRECEQGRVRMPSVLEELATKPVILGLMRKALRDPSPLVRAEMLASLDDAVLGPDILNVVGLVIEDPAPLVRFRVAELIGASGTKGRGRLMELYARDSDPRVQAMARAYEPETLQPETPPAAPANAERNGSSATTP